MHCRTQARLIYVSQPTTGLDGESMDELLQDGRENNRRLRITSLLVDTGRAYVHCLEGEHAAITELYVRISKDARNTDARMVSIEAVSSRYFEGELDYLDARSRLPDRPELDLVRRTAPSDLTRDQVRELFLALAGKSMRSAA